MFVAHLVKCLLSMHEALSSKSSSSSTGGGGACNLYSLVLEAGVSHIQGHLQLNVASLGYIRPCLKKKVKTE